jgi:uncharacterized protein YjbI with pentapeptide repeats
MKFEIKNRWSREVKFTAEIEADENTPWRIKVGLAVKWAIEHAANLTGANLIAADLTDADLTAANLSRANLIAADLSHANLTRANLIRANLSDANLTDANLSRANLIAADLTDADLTDADLTDADLSHANLTRANLTRANLSDANTPFVPPVEDLDGKILAAIKKGGTLKMDNWHICETTHCRAGWAITISPVGRTLESIFGSSVAGALIYSASYPKMKVPDFHATNEAAMDDIKARAALAIK